MNWREIVFSVGLNDLGSLLLTGKEIWASLGANDMKVLKAKHIGKAMWHDERYRCCFLRSVRRDTGQKHGKCISTRGTLRKECNYKNGLRHGVCRIYRRGILVEDGTWVEGRKHGSFFTKNPAVIIQQWKNGILTYEKVYGPNFSIVEVIMAKDKIIKRWSGDSLLSKERFRDGLRHGWQIYYSTGKRRLYRKGKFRTSKPLKKSAS